MAGGGEVIRSLVNEIGLVVDPKSAATAEAAMKRWEERAEAIGRVVAVASGQLADFINQAHAFTKSVNRINRSMEKTGATMQDFAYSSTHASKAMETATHKAANLTEEVSSIGKETWLAAKKTSALGTGLQDLAKGVMDSKKAELAATRARHEGTTAQRSSSTAATEGIGVMGRLGLALMGVREIYGLVTGAAHLLVGGLVDTSREMQSSAKVSGVSTRFFQEMAYAAASVRFQVDDLRDVFVDLSDKVLNGGEDQKKAFKDLGVELRKDGKLRGMEDVFLDLADGFAKMEDGTKKTAYASALLGEQGSRLLPVLSQGSAGLRAWAKEAAEVGAVLDEDTLKASAQFDREMGRLSATGTGLRNILGAALLPALTKLAEGMLRVGKRLAPILKSGAEKWGKRFSLAVDVLTTGVDKLRLGLTLAAGVLLGKFLLGLSTATTGMVSFGSAALIAGARAAIAAALPILPWVLLGAAIALVVDELWGFATGSESALGDFIDWLDKVDPEDNPLVKMLKRAGSLVFDVTDPQKWKRWYSSMKELEFSALAELLKLLSGIIESIKKLPGAIAALKNPFAGSAAQQSAAQGAANYSAAGYTEEQRRDLNRQADLALAKKKYNPTRGFFSGSMQSPEDAVIERARMHGSREWVGRYGLGADTLPSGPNAAAGYFGRGASAQTAVPAIMSKGRPASTYAPSTTVNMTVNAAPGQSAEAVGTAAADRFMDRDAAERRAAHAFFAEE